MTDALPSAPFGRRVRWTQPARVLAAGVSSAAGRARTRLPDADHMFVLARHLAPVAVAVFLAQGFFLAGYFDPMGALPLGVLTLVALVAITAWDYRADIRQRQLIEDLRRRQSDTVQDARAHQTRLADDITRLATVAADDAAAPTLLSAQLTVLTPALVDLLATPSEARRERLLGELEQAGIQACAELAGSEGGQARAVFYRRVGRRFEPSWPEGPWVRPPPPVTRTSETARELRLCSANVTPSVRRRPTPHGLSRERASRSMPGDGGSGSSRRSDRAAVP